MSASTLTHPGTTPDAPADTALLRLVVASRVHGSGETAVTALDGVSLDVTPGELVAVMGPSGCGKSTLLNLAGCLDTATSGAVLVGGVNVARLDARARATLRRRHIGFVFQDFNLVPALTAGENVSLPLELDGMGAKEARRHAEEALASVDLDGVAARFPDDLSGGQRQRVAIARAIVGPRRLLLADEPTGALDSVSGEAVMRVLRERVDAGAAGLLVTHDARHAAWADRTVFLKDGRVVDSTGRAAQPADLLGETAGRAGTGADGSGTDGGDR